MGKYNNSAASYRAKSTHKVLAISPKNGTQTTGFRMSKQVFRRFCIDGMALCEDEQVGDEIYVTAHRKDVSVTTIGRKSTPHRSV